MLVPASLDPGSVTATTPLPPAVPQTPLKAKLDSSTTLLIGGERVQTPLLSRFYAAHGFEPIWDGRERQAAALLRQIERAGEHGINPANFHMASLSKPAMLSPLDRELLISDAVLRYADALAHGAVSMGNRMDDEDLHPTPVDVVATLESALTAADPAATIEALAPRTHEYAALRRAYAEYQAMANAGGRAGPYQRRPGVNTEERIHQLAVALERQRWLPRSLPADRVWVNTADAQLRLFRGDKSVFSTRVVVGEIDKQTPEFQATIENVLFNPPWNVPYSIAQKEILPKLATQPDYLARHHMTIRKGGGIQQMPGPGSALGQLKFEMPNRYDVYLHDTPQKALFSRDNRRQSHGCVRVQNPRELAALLLQDSAEGINKSVGVGTTHRRSLPAALPVFIVYQTAFVDTDGSVQFRFDFYERDEAIWRALNPAHQIPVAEQTAPSQRKG
jgi:murein L,D-transpeptidase YcbB/YkuD